MIWACDFHSAYWLGIVVLKSGQGIVQTNIYENTTYFDLTKPSKTQSNYARRLVHTIMKLEMLSSVGLREMNPLCKSTTAAKLCNDECTNKQIECIISCSHDTPCITDCNREQVKGWRYYIKNDLTLILIAFDPWKVTCQNQCPCYDECFDGCPCEYESEYCRS